MTPSATPATRPSRCTATGWLVSIVVHGVLIALGVLVTWSVVRVDDRLPSPVVTSDAQVTPVAALIEAPPTTEQATRIRMPEIPAASKVQPAPPISGPLVSGSLSIGGPTTAFAGASLGGALDVVFVLDASGSMIAWLPFIIDEVDRTLHAMSENQRFAIIRFAGDRVEATPPGRLQKVSSATVDAAIVATRRAASRAMGGGSDPLPALRRALAMRPDLVLLLSEGLDGRGRASVDRASVLTALDGLNPADAQGDRPVRIACIRLLADDDEAPSQLLEAITRAHGDEEVHLVTPEDLDP